MGYQGKFETWTLQAANNLSDTTPASGALYKGINLQTKDFAAGGNIAAGILQEGCTSGGHATVAIEGVVKGVFIAAINSIGMPLSLTTSGYMKAAGSGDYVSGRNLTTVACGIHAMYFNGLNPWYYNLTDNTSGT